MAIYCCAIRVEFKVTKEPARKKKLNAAPTRSRWMYFGLDFIKSVNNVAWCFFHKLVIHHENESQMHEFFVVQIGPIKLKQSDSVKKKNNENANNMPLLGFTIFETNQWNFVDCIYTASKKYSRFFFLSLSLFRLEKSVWVKERATILFQLTFRLFLWNCECEKRIVNSKALVLVWAFFAHAFL